MAATGAGYPSGDLQAQTPERLPQPDPKRSKVQSPVVKTKQWHIYQGPIRDREGVTKSTALFSANSNTELAASTADYLGIPLGQCSVNKFADGEVSVKVEESVREKDVYIIQPVCRTDTRSVNDTLMELLLMISTMRRASASKITAVIPYFGYARQDRKMSSRVPISAADVATMISAMGVDRVICVDLHCGQIQGFFPPTVPVDNLSAGLVGAHYFAEMPDLKNAVVVSPDAGGVGRAKEFRGVMEGQGHSVGLAMIIKQRSGASQIEKMDLVGSVEGADCIIVDDIVDTAGTLCEAATQLKKHGARRIFAFITHGLLNGPAGERISKSVIDELVVTNTVPLPPSCVGVAQVKQLSIAPLLAETMRRNIQHESLGPDFFR
jgi:ribose-phosphate pyrophosphokinase